MSQSPTNPNAPKGKLPRRTVPVEKRNIMAAPAYICVPDAKSSENVDVYISLSEASEIEQAALAEITKLKNFIFERVLCENLAKWTILGPSYHHSSSCQKCALIGEDYWSEYRTTPPRLEAGASFSGEGKER